jgi:hypothetical protein
LQVPKARGVTPAAKQKTGSSESIGFLPKTSQNDKKNQSKPAAFIKP